MKKIRKRVFAAVLTAFVTVTAMPAALLHTSAERGDAASPAVTHTYEYVIVIEEEQEEESGAAGSVEKEDAADEAAGTGGRAWIPAVNREDGQEDRTGWIILAAQLAAAIVAGTVLAVRKKEDDRGL